MNLRNIKEASNLANKRVLVRVDWNVPLLRQGSAGQAEMLDDFRIRRSMPTIQFLKDAGAEIILATHLDNGSSTDILRQYVPAGAKLLPNLRSNPGEEANLPEFAEELAAQADIYVNEAFSASHRQHASIVGVPALLPSYAGLNFVEEVENLSSAFNPLHPFFLILGGAKFDTKVPLVKKFLDIADRIFIGGANAKPAYEMFKDNHKVSFPHGDIAAPDVDAETIGNLSLEIGKAKFILWNGPLSHYEAGYRQGTLALAKLVADAEAKTIVGGADTLAVIKELDIYDQFSFVSTGGGAMLEFLALGTLPGIEALRNSAQNR